MMDLEKEVNLVPEAAHWTHQPTVPHYVLLKCSNTASLIPCTFTACFDIGGSVKERKTHYAIIIII